MIEKLKINSRVAEVNDASNRISGAYAKTSLSSDSHLSAIMTNLGTESAFLTTAIKRMKAESDLEAKDEIRDEALRALYYLLQGYIHHPVATIKTAAVELDKVFANYGLSITGDNYATESTLINSLLEDLAKEKYQSSVDALSGCSELITALKTTQDDFEEARIAFETEQAEENTLENATALKKKVLNIINDQLVVYLRAMVQVDGETYGSFGNTIAQIIADNNEVVKKRGKKQASTEQTQE